MNQKAAIIILMTLLICSAAYGADDLKTAFTQGTLAGEFRTYAYTRDFDRGTTRRDYASGGMLYYGTDPLHGISAGIAFYTGQSLWLNDSDDDVYGLLAKDADGNHESFSALGEAYLKAEFACTTLKLGRQELETPWVNGDDNRLIPQSVEAYTVVNKSIPGLTLTASYVAQMKGKADTDFVSMTEYAEVGGDEPVLLGGLVYEGVKDLTLQVWDFHAKELMNAMYFRSDYSRPLNETWSVFGAAQYLKQNDTGKKLGGPLDTWAYGLEAGIKGYGLQVSVGYGKVGDQDVLYPWGHDFIVSIMVNDCARAEERGLLGALKYDFGKIGIPGLTGRVRHLDFDTPETGENASYDYSETDFDVFYTFSGFLDGVGIKIRHAIVNKDEAMGGNDYGDTRVMVAYKFDLEK